MTPEQVPPGSPLKVSDSGHQHGLARGEIRLHDDEHGAVVRIYLDVPRH